MVKQSCTLYSNITTNSYAYMIRSILGFYLWCTGGQAVWHTVQQYNNQFICLHDKIYLWDFTYGVLGAKQSGTLQLNSLCHVSLQLHKV